MFFDVNKSKDAKIFMAKYVDKVMAKVRIYQWQSTNKPTNSDGSSTYTAKKWPILTTCGGGA